MLQPIEARPLSHRLCFGVVLMMRQEELDCHKALFCPGNKGVKTFPVGTGKAKALPSIRRVSEQRG